MDNTKLKQDEAIQLFEETIKFQEKRIHTLGLINLKYSAMLEQCRGLTGSLWPQNETTKELANVIWKCEKLLKEK